MITQPKDMVLGDRTFSVPALPLGINLTAYPLCRDLTNSGLLERSIAENGALVCTADEMRQLADLAFLAAMAAEPGLSRAEFDALPVAPHQLLAAFQVIRFQTGAWVSVSAEDGALGEDQGA